jgi:SAM-dependent methyltransferase
MVRVDMGCGVNVTPGFIGLDKREDIGADIVHDLNNYPYPFKDGEAGEILASHVIEDLNDPRRFLLECYRILRPGGLLYLKIPHFSGRGLYNNPYHKNFGVCSLGIVNTITNIDHMGSWLGEDVVFTCIDYGLRYSDTCGNHHKRFIPRLLDFLAGLNPNFCERIWCYWVGGFTEIEIKLIAVKGGRQNFNYYGV